MATIRDKAHVPPSLFNYRQPQTGITYKAHSFGLLVSKVRDGRIGNQIPLGENLAAEIEADFCQRYPELCQDPYAPTEGDPNPSVPGDTITKLAAAIGIPAADALAKLSKMLGINCQRCNSRHRIIRKMKKLGLAETVRQLKETF